MRPFCVGVLGFTLALTACGSASDDGTGTPGGTTNPPVPQTYALYQNQAQMIGAGTALKAGPFTLPKAGSVAYTITNRSTTSPDHWDISIISAAELVYFENGQQYMGFAPHANVSTQSDSSAVPAGTYTIGIVCRNIIEDCQFSLDASMTY